MSSGIHKLSSSFIRNVTKPGLYSDGAGLFLQVTQGTDGGARRSWVVRVRLPTGKTREMGLGIALPDNLARIRKQAAEAREIAREGIDPIEHRKAERLRRAMATGRAMTFKECAEAYIESHRPGWRNEKHAAQWSATLSAYVYPVFGDAPVQSINVLMVLKAIEPIWKTRTETASRVRQRIEAVLNWAKARGLREGENPALWRGHLDKILPARAKVQRVSHHAAMKYSALPEFMAELTQSGSRTAPALGFLILTACRTSEVLLAKWDEFDLGAALWTIPAERMKAGREHRVPLSPETMTILRRAKLDHASSAYVFPGARAGRPLSNMVLLQLMERMGRGHLTAHGFRSTFRDWAAEQTNFPREVAEAALAHVVSDKVEAAYRRSDLFEKRRALMEAWSEYANRPRPAPDRFGVVAHAWSDNLA